MTIADHKFVIYLFIACTAATLTAYLQQLHLRSPPFANNRIRFENSSPSTGTNSITPNSSSATMSFSYHDDYKAFVFAQHPTHGLLLLYCTRKKKKPNHFQAPGGHVDEADFDEAKELEQSKTEEGPADILVKACTIGAARELFEETGIDLRSSLDRLQPVRLRENSDDKLNCELKKRLFFRLNLVDSDFVTSGIESKVSSGLTQSMNTNPPQLMLKLSHEHQGFIFEPNATKAADMLVEHSGGKVAKALRKAIDNEQIFSLIDEKLIPRYLLFV